MRSLRGPSRRQSSDDRFQRGAGASAGRRPKNKLETLVSQSKSWRADHQVAPAGNRQRPASPLIELSPGQMNDAPMAELLLNDLPAGAGMSSPTRDTTRTGSGTLIEDQVDSHTTHPAEIKPLLTASPTAKRNTRSATLSSAASTSFKQFSDTSQPDTTAALSTLSRHDQNRLRPSLAQVL